MRYDLLEPDKNNVEASVQHLGDVVSPLLVKGWVQFGGDKLYGHDFSLHVESFIHTWLQGVTKIFVAYDDNNVPAGFIVGILYRPMQFNCSVIQIESMYYETPEVKKGLLDYLKNAIRFFNAEEIWCSFFLGDTDLGIDGWKETNTIEIRRWVK